MGLRTGISLGLMLIFFVSILLIDWLFILRILGLAPVISHWLTALPMIIILLFAMTLLALIGIFYENVWGYVLAYLNIILSIYFSYVAYESIATIGMTSNWRFVALIIANLIIFIYLAFFHYYSSKPLRSKKMKHRSFE